MQPMPHGWDNADAQHDERRLWQKAIAPLIYPKQRHQISYRDVNEAAGGDHQKIGNQCLGSLQCQISQQAADNRTQAGGSVGDQRVTASPAGIKQDGEIAQFLRDFMQHDRQCGGDAQPGIGEEGGGNQDAIDEIMESIPDQDQRYGTLA